MWCLRQNAAMSSLEIPRLADFIAESLPSRYQPIANPINDRTMVTSPMTMQTAKRTKVVRQPMEKNNRQRRRNGSTTADLLARSAGVPFHAAHEDQLQPLMGKRDKLLSIALGFSARAR
jgi:hypothetical protein